MEVKDEWYKDIPIGEDEKQYIETINDVFK